MNEAAIESAHWAGTLTIASMAAVFSGRGGEATEHCHPAHIIISGGTVIMDSRSVSARHTPLAIPAGIRHRISATEQEVILAYLDPRRFAWSAVERMTSRWQGVGVNPGVGSLLAEDIRRVPARRVDSRALAAVARIAGGMSLGEVALGLGLSESRTTHLVSEQLGAPLRVWRSWLRLQQAVDLVAAGNNVTEAAYAAGFADSAHFSRTCRMTLGFPPSVLSATRIDNLREAESCTAPLT